MVAPLPQERTFKQEFDRTRLAAIRGDNFTIPEAANNNNLYAEDENTQAANNNRFFPSGSEDGILAQYPLGSPLPGAMDTNAIDPNNFSYLQQQARIAEGVDAPSLLPDDIAALPDPEYSTDEDPVTYGESLSALEQRAREAEDIESVQEASQDIRNKVQQATHQANEEFNKLIEEKVSRWFAKGAGNGSNATGSVGWDGFTSFTLSYLYLMARGLVSILSPETQAPQDLRTFSQGVRYNSQKLLHRLIPPYRPFREPGDFMYFLGAVILSILAICVTLAIFISIFSIAFFPFIAPGGPLFH